jgi:Glycosyl hydrolases family 18
LVATLAAIVAIAVTTTILSLLMSDGPQAAGAPPLATPAPSHSPLPQLASGDWPATAPSSAPATCRQQQLQGVDGGWVVSYLDDNSNDTDLVADEAHKLSLVDFYWSSLATPTDLVQTDSFDPTLGTELATAAASGAGPCGLRFVTLADNDPDLSHTADVRMLARILTNPRIRQEHVLAVARWMASQPLATGLTLDYEFGLPKTLSDLRIDEQVAGWHGLSLDNAVNRLSGDYTELIRELAAAMHKQHRLLRLAAPVRRSDDVDAATTDIAPYVLDYGTLAQYADQMVLLAYDFAYQAGNPGPIAPFAAVAQVLSYVRSYNVPLDKLAVAVPLYAYDWTVNDKGGIALGANGQPITATSLTSTQVAAKSKHWRKVATENGETEYTYTQGRQKHIVWSTSSALVTEVAWLRRTYPHVGIDVWMIGNADPSGSALAVHVLGG